MAMQVEKINEVWSFGAIDGFIGGLNFSQDATRIADEESPEISNLVFSKQLTIRDTGYITAGAAIASNPRTVAKFKRSTGVIEYVLIADASAYKWNATLGKWLILSGSNTTTATVGEPAGETSIAVVSGANFANGDAIALVLDNSDIHLSTVSSGGGTNTLVIAAGIPVGRNLPAGGTVFEPVVFAGDPEKPVDFVVYQAVNWLVICNGVDSPWRYNGSTVEKIPNLPSAGNFIATTCAVFNNHLFFGNCTEGGTAMPYRIRRSDVGDPTNWSTGDAGFTDLLDFPDAIVKLLPLGPYLIAYRDNIISRGVWIGAADLLISFEIAVSGTGILGLHAVAQVETFHMLVANDNFYEYRGGYEVRPIGDKLFDHIYGRFAELNKAKQSKIWVQEVEELGEVWFAIPEGTSSYISHIMRLHRQGGELKWTHRRFNINVLGFGVFQSLSATAWNQLVGSWTQQSGSWLSLSQRGGLDGIAICCAAPAQVFYYDYAAVSDAGVAIAWRVESKDFTTRFSAIRIDQLVFFYKGSDITVQYSLDSGGTWAPYGSLPNRSNLGQAVVDRQVVGDSFRFALSGSSEVQLGWFGITFSQEDLG